jgi:hypothetical protein
MDVPVPDSVLSALRKLRRELRAKLDGLLTTRSTWEKELESKLQAVNQEIEFKQRMLDLVTATEMQLAGWGGVPDLGGAEPEASTQVRGDSRTLVSPCGSLGLYPCCDSPCQQLPSSGPDQVCYLLSLNPSRRGPSPWRFGRITCCRC